MRAFLSTSQSRRVVRDDRLGAKFWLGAAVAILGTAILSTMIVGRYRAKAERRIAPGVIEGPDESSRMTSCPTIAIL